MAERAAVQPAAVHVARSAGRWLGTPKRSLYPGPLSLAQPPAIRPGGVEAYALEVYEAMRDAGEFEPLFLARSGPPSRPSPPPPRGRAVHARQRRSEPVPLLHATCAGATTGCSARRRKAALTRFFRDFLLDQKPDIVHFQHTMFLGYDIVRVDAEHAARRADRLHAARVPADLPPRRPDGAHDEPRAVPGGLAAPLSRVLPATSARRPSSCASASSSRTCRPSTCSWRPASYVLDQYVDWGIPREKIVLEPHGMRAGPAPCRTSGEAASATASASSASSPPTRARTCCSKRDGAAGRGLRRAVCWSTARTSRPADRVPGRGSSDC